MPTEKEIMQLKYDKAQYQFALDGTIIINQKVTDEQTPLIALINQNNYYICPFCLEKSNKFTIENKGLIKCSNCSNFMKLKTILFVKDCTNQQYAQWVFDYRLSGFFKKINFEKWSKKLKELGMSYEFWDEYKKLKGENEKEESEFNNEQREIIINGLISFINKGMSKDKILEDLVKSNIDFEIETFNYCYNEALCRVKNKGV